MDAYTKRGYLHEDFRIFYLRDHGWEEMHAHYHDFDKIVVFLNGNASYNIEGRIYPLEPYDIVLVNQGEIHRPLLHGPQEYERMIFYLGPDFPAQYSDGVLDLHACFDRARAADSHVLKIPSIRRTRLSRVLEDLKAELQSPDRPGFPLATRLLLLEFLLELNRAGQSDHIRYPASSGEDTRIVRVLAYLHAHLTEPLTIDQIAGAFFVSPSHLMHEFKQETGSSIGQYLTRKRLLLARERIAAGQSHTDAAFACGFQSYSAFYRAYRKIFGTAPGQESPGAERFFP